MISMSTYRERVEKNAEVLAKRQLDIGQRVWPQLASAGTEDRPVQEGP